MPTHQPRVSGVNQLSHEMRFDRSGIFSFHRPLLCPVDKKQLSRSPFSPLLISAIAGMNKHPFSLTALGILPNQLRKVWTPEFGDPEVVLNDLRWTSFWGGYQVWKARMRLVRTYWKNRNTKRSSKTFHSSTVKTLFIFLQNGSTFLSKNSQDVHVLE